jgi:hypothetical protein
MLVVPHHVGQMLVQRPTERDVEHLRAAADPEDGQSAAQRLGQQRELESVTGGGRFVGLRVPLLTVCGWVDVPAPVITRPSSPSSIRAAMASSTGCGGRSVAIPPALVTPSM